MPCSCCRTRVNKVSAFVLLCLESVMPLVSFPRKKRRLNLSYLWVCPETSTSTSSVRAIPLSASRSPQGTDWWPWIKPIRIWLWVTVTDSGRFACETLVRIWRLSLEENRENYGLHRSRPWRRVCHLPQFASTRTFLYRRRFQYKVFVESSLEPWNMYPRFSLWREVINCALTSNFLNFAGRSWILIQLQSFHS